MILKDKTVKSKDEFDGENAVFQQEFLHKDREQTCDTACIDDEDAEYSSCNGATSSSNCSEMTSASFDDAMTTFCRDVDLLSENCTSSTKIGQLMKTQARRRANTTCCLDLVSKCNVNHAAEEMKFDLSWNPIVFDHGSMSQGPACSFSGCYGRSYSWGASRCSRNQSFNR